MEIWGQTVTLVGGYKWDLLNGSTLTSQRQLRAPVRKGDRHWECGGRKCQVGSQRGVLGPQGRAWVLPFLASAFYF